MDGLELGGIVVGVLLLIGLVVLVVARRRAGAPPEEADPYFIAGIALSGSGAALFATIGPVGAAMLAMGVVLMVVGITRTRRGHRHH